MTDEGALIDYRGYLYRASRALVQELLSDVARTGVPAGHELYLTLRTGAPGVDLPESVRAEYPEEITLVLRQRTWDNLEVDAERFSVTLQFGTLPARVTVPFASLVRFFDPKARVVFELGPPGEAGTTESAAGEDTSAPEPDETATDGEASYGNVVSFPRPAERRDPPPSK